MNILNNIPIEVDINALLASVHVKPESNAGKELEHLIATIRLVVKFSA